MEEFDPTKIALYIRLAIFGVFLILVLVFLLRSRNTPKVESKKLQQENFEIKPAHETDKHVLAGLTVKESDDPSLADKVFYILKYPVTLGRNPNNDFVFPDDLPVSNFHAKLTMSDDKVMLSEMVLDAKGTEKRPKYGTFVNGIPLRIQAIELSDGDEIRLGPRLRLLYERVDMSHLPGTVDEKTARIRP